MHVLQKWWKSQRAQIIEGIYLLKYTKDEVTGALASVSDADEHRIGAPYIHGLIRLFIQGFPVVSYTKLSIECKAKKK